MTSETLGDLHLHTDQSPDDLEKADYSLEEALELAKHNGLYVLAVTEHGVFHDYDNSQQLADRAGIILIPGSELRALITEGLRYKIAKLLGFNPRNVTADILALGVTEPIPEQELSLEKLIEEIHNQGGLAIIPHAALHPGINWLSSSGQKLIAELGIDGIEVINASIPRYANQKAANLAQQMRLAQTGGSDARTRSMIGKAVTVFNPQVDIKTWQDCIEAIRRGQTSARGETLAAVPYLLQNYPKALQAGRVIIEKWRKGE